MGTEPAANLSHTSWDEPPRILSKQLFKSVVDILHSNCQCKLWRCRFLEQCSEYGLLGPDEKAALMEAQGQGSIDPATRRTQKIARIRLEKAARAKLDALRMQVH